MRALVKTGAHSSFWSKFIAGVNLWKKLLKQLDIYLHGVYTSKYPLGVFYKRSKK